MTRVPDPPSPSEPAPVPPPRPPSPWFSASGLGLIAVAVFAGVVSAMTGLGVYIFPFLGLVAIAVAAAGLLRTSYLLVASLIRTRAVPPGTFVDLVKHVLMALIGFGLAVLGITVFGRGRQLRRRGRILLAPLSGGPAWTRVKTTPAVDEACRAALAAQWRENGRTEHASVAAFSRLALDLVSLGAPPELIASAHRDALDEVRHAELCFGLARSLDGRDVSPAAFPDAGRVRTLLPTRTLSLAALATDALVDGALHEGMSAAVIARTAARCEDDAIRAILEEIAADEGRHARHGWDVVGWCLAEGGDPVASALQGALRAVPRATGAALPEAARDGSWERHGIPGEAIEREEHARMRAHVVRRLTALLAARDASLAA